MACEESEKKCFTFLWKLENISYCLQRKGTRIESPSFVVDEIDESKWKLWLYPRGEKDGKIIGYYLCREKDSKGPDKIQINYELSLVSTNDTDLKYLSARKKDFSKNLIRGYPRFCTQEVVFIPKRSLFLPQDTLTARCRIWKSVGEMTEDVRCTARTRIGVEKRSYLWNIKDFSTLEPEKKCTYRIKSVENEAPLMSVDLFLSGGSSSEEIIHFELSLHDESIKFSTLKLFLINTSGSSVECNYEEFWFTDLAACKQFTPSFTKKKLLAKKSIYLPNDTLSLHWEWVFSKGELSKEIEEVQYGSTISESKISDARNMNGENVVPLSHTLYDNLKSLYDDKKFCDVKLKTNTAIFPSHKVILSASSSVFKAMFLSDMKEEHGDCAGIEDLSDDAVRRMLFYIYTARVEDLTWENASHLYVAADKYAILNLKDICSSFLKDNISPSNVCEVLLLADLHADGDLKSAAQNYILKHDKDIVNSDEWRLLMESNVKLAAETLCLRYE